MAKRTMQFVHVYLERQICTAFSHASETINKGEYPIQIETTAFCVHELKEKNKIEEFRQAVSKADLVFIAHVFLDDVARTIAEIIRNEGKIVPHVVILNAMPELMKLNRMGAFKMGGDSDQTSEYMKLLKRFKKSDSDEETAATKKSGPPLKTDQMMMLIRTVPKLLKFIPGKMQDLRSYLLCYLYWLNGSPKNLCNMLLMLINQYYSREDETILYDAPVEYAEEGIYHPESDVWFTSRADYEKWYAHHAPSKRRIGLIVLRTSLLADNHDHYDAVIRSLERKGLGVVPGIAKGLDYRHVVEHMFMHKGEATVDGVITLTSFSLVGGPASNDAESAVKVLSSLGVPYLSAVPLEFQTIKEWKEDMSGLNPVQVALNVAIPELDGLVAPTVYSGYEIHGGSKAIPIESGIELLTERMRRVVELRHKNNADKKLGIVIFSFPPDKGNIGTAAYLDVFQSLYNLLHRLKAEGYTVEIPASKEALLESIIEDKTSMLPSAALHVGGRLTMEEYEAINPYWEEIAQTWGQPPGDLNTDGQDLHIYGNHFGNIFIGVQPSFGYESDPIKLLFTRSACPHHGFAAFYRWLDRVYGADALLHFGTHGALEFMPGHQVGLTDECWPDRLLGPVPNFYLYSVNNPSEATIAKRRSAATTVSYLTPPAENAGLYKELRDLKDLISMWGENRSNARGESILETIVEKVQALHLDSDVPVPKEPGQDFIGKLYTYLTELESRLIPTGLHVLGEAPPAETLVDHLTAIGAFDRPEQGVRALSSLLAEAMGQKFADIERRMEMGEETAIRLIELIRATIKVGVEKMIAEYMVKDERGGFRFLRSKSETIAAKAMQDHLTSVGKQASSLDITAAAKTFFYLQSVLQDLVQEKEIDGLCHAVAGNYAYPGPGGDPVRNPKTLPTGRNIHALDPQAIPTSVAIKAGQHVADMMLRKLHEANGAYPESIAVVLWGTDNIKTYGEGIAQAMALMGAMAVPDDLGRMTRLKLIPLEELGRPRIDVVVTVSGIFRDMFQNQMELLDEAVKLAAMADEPVEMNFIRKHALAQAKELNISIESAATRVFSNAPGSYGGNVNQMVENSAWEEAGELADTFIKRKGFAYGKQVRGEVADEIYRSALSNVETSFQNVDSSEVGIVDIDHYYEYLGGVSAAVKSIRGEKPSVLVADTTTPKVQIRNLDEMVRFETRTKTLNPKWYEGMLKHGYEGVREIQSRVDNTFGWSATTEAVDNWVYDEITEVYITDEEMRQRLQELNAHALRGIVSRLLEANSRGFWDADEQKLEQLMKIYQDIEDKIEGVSVPA
ncbi:magnesium chelatase subunit H [Heliophilum fasciatum]|uniref:magnesium chelatase n=1 Tax=Heliophilum fasciatum TaxID=35700 RepID=A0A4R2RZU1_9FIRM|nr:magnesium chelatase subunit H [Heliophilum fasciatum]MCW2277057.1 magnesium chelatase subunit H [Heliophilum fasciatum]TCP68417.1 cobaltochelatase CobN subunit [Heliophilum fasciatum]